MRINIKTTNIDLTPSIEAMTENKLISPVKKLLSKIDKNADIIFDIELSKTTKHHVKGKIWRCEAQLDLPGKKRTLRAEARADSLREAMNLTKDTILREIKQYKEKMRVQG